MAPACAQVILLPVQLWLKSRCTVKISSYGPCEAYVTQWRVQSLDTDARTPTWHMTCPPAKKKHLFVRALKTKVSREQQYKAECVYLKAQCITFKGRIEKIICMLILCFHSLIMIYMTNNIASLCIYSSPEHGSAHLRKMWDQVGHQRWININIVSFLTIGSR